MKYCTVCGDPLPKLTRYAVHLERICIENLQNRVRILTDRDDKNCLIHKKDQA